MPRHERRHHRYHGSNVSRRDFIRMSVQVSLSTLLIGISKYFADRASFEITDETDEEYLKNALPEHMHRLVDEIAADRQVLKLPPLPAYLHKDRVRSSQFVYWEVNPGTIQHAVPESYTSFAMQSERIMRILYGDNAPRLVKQIAKDDSVRSAGTFNGGSRVLKADTTDTITGGNVLFVNLHEDAHANDPQITDADLYPLETLVHVTHGISRILSQANEMEGYYLKNPESYNIPFIKKQIGEGIGTLMRRDPTLEGQMDDESYDNLMAILIDIASSRGVAIADLKFTKHVCLQIGGACLPQILDGSIRLSGELANEWYIPKMTDACIEIYADMFANALFYPDRFADDTVLIDGVMEIIRSIRGEDVTYEQILAELAETPQDILDRYAHEQELISMAQGQTVEPTQEQPSPEELERIRQEQELYEKQTQQYWDIIQQGYVSPDLPIAANSVRKSVEEYANAYAQVYAEYGDLIFYASTKDNMNFDPDQDIWITRDISVALNPDIIWYIVTDPDYAANMKDELESHTRILNAFIVSDAFRTNVTARIPMDSEESLAFQELANA